MRVCIFWSFRRLQYGAKPAIIACFSFYVIKLNFSGCFWCNF